MLLKEVEEPERFGVAEIEDGRIKRIIEKPKKPPTNFAIIGIYMYDSQVFEFIHTLRPSDRGELEITDVNNMYLRKKQLTYGFLKGWWTDAGTFESLLKANVLVSKNKTVPVCRKS